MTIPNELNDILRVAEILSILFAGGGLFYRMGRMTMRFEELGKQQGVEISELKEGVKELIDTNRRLERVEERQIQEGKRLDELQSRFNKMIDIR